MMRALVFILMPVQRQCSRDTAQTTAQAQMEPGFGAQDTGQVQAPQMSKGGHAVGASQLSPKMTLGDGKLILPWGRWGNDDKDDAKYAPFTGFPPASESKAEPASKARSKAGFRKKARPKAGPASQASESKGGPASESKLGIMIELQTANIGKAWALEKAGLKPIIKGIGDQLSDRGISATVLHPGDFEQPKTDPPKFVQIDGDHFEPIRPVTVFRVPPISIPKVSVFPILVLVNGVDDIGKLSQATLGDVFDGLFKQLKNGQKFVDQSGNLTEEWATNEKGEPMKDLKTQISEDPQLKGSMNLDMYQIEKLTGYQIRLTLEFDKNAVIAITAGGKLGFSSPTPLLASRVRQLGLKMTNSTVILNTIFNEVSAQLVQKTNESGIDITIHPLNLDEFVEYHRKEARAEVASDATIWKQGEGRGAKIGLKLTFTVNSLNKNFAKEQFAVLVKEIFNALQHDLPQQLVQKGHDTVTPYFAFATCGWKPENVKRPPFPHDLIPCPKKAPLSFEPCPT